MKLTAPEGLSFSGHIEIPDNITGRMFCAWWQAHKPVANKRSDDYENSDILKQWRGAVALVNGWGDVEIEGINRGDITPDGDNVPIEFIAWLGREVDMHLGALLSLKKTVNR